VSAIIKQFVSKNKSKERATFLEQLYKIEELYLMGIIDEVIVLARGQDKCCTSNSLNVKTVKSICYDFVNNTREYIGKK
jgi:hypothetical protein